MAQDHPLQGSAAGGGPRAGAGGSEPSRAVHLGDHFDPESSKILCEAQASADPIGVLVDALLRRSHHQPAGFPDRFVRHVLAEVDASPSTGRPAKQLRLDYAPVLLRRAVAGALAACWGQLHPTVQLQAEAALTRHVRDAAMLRLLAQSTLPPSLQAHCRSAAPSEYAKRAMALFAGMRKEADEVEGGWEAEEKRRAASEMEEERRKLERARKAADEVHGGHGDAGSAKRQRTGGGGDSQGQQAGPSAPADRAPAQRPPEAEEPPAVDTAAMAKLKASLAAVRPHGGAESLPKELGSLLEVPRLEEALSLVAMHELGDEVLLLLVGQLFKGGTSQRQAQGFMRCVLLPKVQRLGQPASRALLSAILKTCKDHPRAAIHHLILPLLANEQVGSAPVEVVNRIAKDSLLEAQRVLLLSAILDAHSPEGGRGLTLVSIAVLQGLVNLKIPMGPSELQKFIQVLDAGCVVLSKQLKFSSLVLSLLSQHGRQLAPFAPQLLQIASSLETSLKKPILAMANKLSPA